MTTICLLVIIVYLLYAPKIEKLESEESYPVIGHEEDVYEYYKGLLSDDEKVIYEDFLETALQFESKFKLQIEEIQKDDLKKIYDFFLMDHPEVFWMYGYTVTCYPENDEVDTLFPIELMYRYTIEEANQKLENMKKNIEPIVQGASSLSTDREKVDYVRDKIMELATLNKVDENDIEASNDYYSIVSIFEVGKTMCGGYGYGFKYLMDKVGVKAICILDSHETAAESHIWDMVYLDGTWYNLDISFDDELKDIYNIDSDKYYLVESNEEFNLDGHHPISKYLPNL